MYGYLSDPKKHDYVDEKMETFRTDGGVESKTVDHNWSNFDSDS